MDACARLLVPWRRMTRRGKKRTHVPGTAAPGLNVAFSPAHSPPTHPTHTARFSPDDKFSKQRITLKKRFNLLPTQQGERVL